MAQDYDPNVRYDPDTEYTLRGKLVNKISQIILDLRQEVKDLKDAEVMKELEDLRIRDRHPAVKDAWDQYQTVLKLARDKQ